MAAHRCVMCGHTTGIAANLLVRILSSTEGLICPDFVLTQTEQFQNDDKTANG